MSADALAFRSRPILWVGIEGGKDRENLPEAEEIFDLLVLSLWRDVLDEDGGGHYNCSSCSLRGRRVVIGVRWDG